MKKLFYLLLFFISSCGVAYGQIDIQTAKPVGGNPSDLSTYNKQTLVTPNNRFKLTLYIPTGSTATLNNAKDSTGAVYFAQVDTSYNIRLNGTWIKFKTYANALNGLALKVNKADSNQLNVVGSYATPLYANNASPKIPGSIPVSSTPSIGDSPGTNLSASAWIIAEFYKTQAPTAGLSGGVAYERHAAGTFTGTLSWSYGKQANTANIATATITGNSNTYPEFGAQPGANSSITGTQSATGIPYNSTVTYTMLVTTSDSKTASASTTYSIYDKGYAGWATSGLSGGLPTAANVLAANIQDNSGGATINTQVQAQQGSDKNYFFVTTTTRSHVSVNGTPSDAAFTFNVPITFTNSNGGTFNGYAQVSNFQIGSTGGITFIFN